MTGGRRTLLIGILLYVTVDLSLAWMPGAFVFDASDSFEGIQTVRGRDAAHVVDTQPSHLDVVATVEPGASTRLVLRTREPIADRIVTFQKTLPRATRDASPPSEDAD